MSAYEILKDFAAPAATVIASITAAAVTSVFAIGQWKTAHVQAQIALDKLKIETFERRMQVLTAARSLIRLVVNAKPRELPDLAQMQDLQRIIDDGRFLFSGQIRDHLQTITNACYDAVNFDPYSAERKLTAEEQAELLKRTEARRKIIKEIQGLPSILEKDIAPNFLNNNAVVEDKIVNAWFESIHFRLAFGRVCAVALIVCVLMLFAVAVSRSSGR